MIIILKRKGKLLAVIVYIQHGRTVCGNSGLFDTFKLPQFRSHVQICAGRYCGQRCTDRSSGFHRLDVGIIFIVGVLTPDNNSDLRGLLGLPLRLIGGVFCRNGCGHSGLPSAKRITGLSGIFNLYGRAKAGIDGFYAVAAVKVKAHHVVIAVILYLNYRAAVRRHLGFGIIQQRCKAGICFGKAIAYFTLGEAANFFRFVQRIVVVRNVLQIVVNSKAYVRRIVGYCISHVLGYVVNSNINGCLDRLVAHNRRTRYCLFEIAAFCQSSSPRRCGLLTILENVVDDNGMLSIRYRQRRYQRRQHEHCQNHRQHSFGFVHAIPSSLLSSSVFFRAEPNAPRPLCKPPPAGTENKRLRHKPEPLDLLSAAQCSQRTRLSL